MSKKLKNNIHTAIQNICKIQMEEKVNFTRFFELSELPNDTFKGQAIINVDLRDSDLTKLDLDGVKFINCKTNAATKFPENFQSSQLAKSVRVIIPNGRGMGARASAKFVMTVEKFEADVTITKDEITVAGSSIMSLLMLAAAPDSEVTIEATGQQRKESVQALCELVKGNFF